MRNWYFSLVFAEIIQSLRSYPRNSLRFSRSRSFCRSSPRFLAKVCERSAIFLRNVNKSVQSSQDFSRFSNNFIAFSQQFLKELCKIKEIRASSLFETFFAFDIHAKPARFFESARVSLRTSLLEDISLVNNKENVDFKEFSDTKAKKRATDTRVSLKNVSFREIFNDVNKKLSNSNLNSNSSSMRAAELCAKKPSYATNNKHLALLQQKTPNSSAFYLRTADFKEKTVINSPLHAKIEQNQ